MKKPSRRSSKTSQDEQVADAFSVAIRALGDYAHVTVRSQRGLLYVYADDSEDPVARFHPLRTEGTYGLSFHHHSGRWEPMPYSGDLAHITTVLVQTLGAYIARPEDAPGISGSHH